MENISFELRLLIAFFCAIIGTIIGMKLIDKFMDWLWHR